MKIGIFSFFAGAGFLDHGFETEGFEILFANEFYGPFLHAYKESRANLSISEPQYGFYEGSAEDLLGTQQTLLTQILQKARQGNDLTGFIGGPPCPDFSIGGKNRGRHGNNGRLSDSYVELICQQRPDFFLYENVKGLWQTARHRVFFEEIKHKAQQAGYVTSEKLINALEYGVPQDRSRIILIGFQRHILRDLGVPLSEQEHVLPAKLFPWRTSAKYPIEIMPTLPWPTTDPFAEDSITSCPEEILEDLTVEHWFRQNDVLHHINGERYFTPRAALPRFQSVLEGDDSKKSFKRLHRWRYSPTAAYGNNEVHIHPYKARRISAAEALAIQSLPATFALPNDMTLSDTFKAIGNGVPYLAAQGLARSLKSFLEGLDEINSRRSCESDQPSFPKQDILLY